MLGELTQRFPEGSHLALLHSDGRLSSPTNLTPDFFAAADPQMNFEGAKVLFSGQKTAGDRWQIWEMDADGANQRQITRCTSDCMRAAYLPGDEIAFTVIQKNGENTESYLAEAKRDGTETHRITFGPAPFQLETVLRDGRILASAPWPLLGNSNNTKTRLFYALRPDGTALESFRCVHAQSTVQSDGVELEDGSIAYIERSQTGSESGGKLTRILRGALQPASFSGKRALYRSPQQLSAEELIVSKEEASPTGSSARFDLYAFHIGSGILGERIYGDAKLSSLQAVPVTAHVVPKKYMSLVNPDSLAGFFITLDSYLTADEPHGRFATPIAQVRVLTPGQSSDQEGSLGEAPVEKDGSFYVQVPANLPVRFELLDAKRQIIHAEKSWIWARPGEERGCPGCHGDKAIAPENHWPLTLKRFDTPTHLGDTEHGSSNSQAN